MKIYTHTGDKGTTSIAGNKRVDKDDIRIETNGCIDELNAAIGIVRANLPQEHEWQATLKNIQQELMHLMSLIATPSDSRQESKMKVDKNMPAVCEKLIDA